MAAPVTPIRQRTQYSCGAASLSMALKALGCTMCDEDKVNEVMGAAPMQGAAWEQIAAAANHYGCRSTLVVPATLAMVKGWTDAGKPVLIGWNPEDRPWSHASLVFDVTDTTVFVADPNCPDPSQTVREVPIADFYKKWSEEWNGYKVRRPAMLIDREVDSEGRQMVASKRAKEINKFWVVRDPGTGSELGDILISVNTDTLAQLVIGTGLSNWKKERTTIHDDKASAEKDAKERLARMGKKVAAQRKARYDYGQTTDLSENTSRLPEDVAITASGDPWKDTAKKLLDARKGTGQDDLHYRAYLRAIISGQNPSHLTKQFDGAKEAMRDLIDERGKLKTASEHEADSDGSDMKLEDHYTLLPRSLTAKFSTSYRSLNDAVEITSDPRYMKGDTKIWYSKPKFSRHFMDILLRKGPYPTPQSIPQTHILIGSISERNPRAIVTMMQGEVWSPNMEAWDMPSIRAAGHTSMAPGDVIQIGNKWLMADRRFNFIELNQDTFQSVYARFEEGKSVDVPKYLREHGNPEAAEEWIEQNEANRDKFKTAGVVDQIRGGDRVTILTPQGQQVTGTAVMKGPHGWVLNMGGKHGRPGIASEENIVKVVPTKNPRPTFRASSSSAASAKQAMREDKATEILEDMIGVDKSFRLMRLWQSAQQAASGNRYTLSNTVDPIELFVRKAREDRYPDKAIAHYIVNIQGGRLPKGLRLASDKVAVDLPADVERYVKEIKESNPDYDEAQTWATAWSIYCKHKNPGSDHCQRPPSEYLTKQACGELDEAWGETLDDGLMACGDGVMADWEEGSVISPPTSGPGTAYTEMWGSDTPDGLGNEVKRAFEEDGESLLAGLDFMAEGCPDNLDEAECGEWEANTEKYKDVVKDQHKAARQRLSWSRGANLDDACWEGYEAIGTKEQDGKQVPNCVPVEKQASLPTTVQGWLEWED